MKCRERVEQKSSHGVSESKRWPEMGTIEPQSITASKENNPSSNDIEVIWMLGGGVKNESSGNAPSNNEYNSRVNGHPYDDQTRLVV
jgi:hypothetical protein